MSHESAPTLRKFRNVTMDMGSLGPGSYDTDAIAANLDGVDALIVHKAPVLRELIESADLSLVAAAHSGTENVDLEAAADNDVTVLHAPG